MPPILLMLISSTGRHLHLPLRYTLVNSLDVSLKVITPRMSAERCIIVSLEKHKQSYSPEVARSATIQEVPRSTFAYYQFSYCYLHVATYDHVSHLQVLLITCRSKSIPSETFSTLCRRVILPCLAD